jgi:peptide/nickel transport system permease protein
MSAYFLRRILGAIPLLLGVAALSFAFMHMMPGGPDALLARNGRLSAEQLAKVRRSLGVDQPVPVQFVKWLGDIARGDFGISFNQFRPVSQVIGERVPNTFKLIVFAVLLSVAFALGVGILSALKRNTTVDYILSVLAYIGLAVPTFWLGLMLQLLFAVRLGWLPSADMTAGRGFWDDLKHLALPVTALVISMSGEWSRYVRASVIDTIQLEYVRTARAKGLPERMVIWKHVLRNSLVPFVTVVAIDASAFLVGAVVTETIFSWPGLGRLFFDSLRSRDYPVLMGLLVLSAILIVACNIVADLIYTLLDPRITYTQ